jgi:ABC-2 type transport system ATP-binding protein
MMENIIEIRNIRKTFKGREKPALNGITLDVQNNLMFGLIGADGAGKSTLLKILATLMSQDSGTALVMGADVLADRRAIRVNTGYMPQRFSLYHDLTVRENLQFFADVFGVRGPQRVRRFDRLLLFSRLGPFVNRRAGNLSGGMKQKLALCCALIHAPKLVILDEPTTGVDPVSRNEFWEILRELIAEGVTIVVSTPYMDETRYCDRVAMIHEGAVLCQGTPKDLLASFPHELYRVDAKSGFSGGKGGLDKLPEFVRRLYPSGGDTKVVVSRGSDTGQVKGWIRKNIAGAGVIETSDAVMEDVFIERLSGNPEPVEPERMA